MFAIRNTKTDRFQKFWDPKKGWRETGTRKEIETAFKEQFHAMKGAVIVKLVEA